MSPLCDKLRKLAFPLKEKHASDHGFVQSVGQLESHLESTTRKLKKVYSTKKKEKRFPKYLNKLRLSLSDTEEIMTIRVRKKMRSKPLKTHSHCISRNKSLFLRSDVFPINSGIFHSPANPTPHQLPPVEKVQTTNTKSVIGCVQKDEGLKRRAASFQQL